MAINKERVKKQLLIHHSDRGTILCANDYQNTLNKKTEYYLTTQNLTHMKMQYERINGILNRNLD
jgi:hypothetical protein